MTFATSGSSPKVFLTGELVPLDTVINLAFPAINHEPRTSKPLCELLVTNVAKVRTTSVEKLALTTVFKVVIKEGKTSFENVPDRNANNIFFTISNPRQPL